MGRILNVILVVLIFGLMAFGLVTYFLRSRQVLPRNSQIFVQDKEKVTELTGVLTTDAPQIPVYFQAKIIKSYRKEFGDHVEYVMKWQVQADVPTVASWYATELVKAGWTVTGPDFPGDMAEQQVDAENERYRLKILVAQEDELLVLAEFKEKIK